MNDTPRIMASDSKTLKSPTLKDPRLLRQINQLRKTDNVKGWLYLVREYLFLLTVVGSAIWFYHWLEASSYSLLWWIPAALVAVVLVGAGQHRLVTLAHEAAHYMLFRNRLLNEFVSEWFCMFPVLGTTHKYRVQHLGHHQFPNDPERDTDFVQLGASGHRFQFPMSRAEFLWKCVFKQLLWLPNPIRYALVRATFDGTNDSGPYRRLGGRHYLLPVVSVLYLLALIGSVIYFAWQGDSFSLFLVPALIFAAAFSLFVLVPEKYFTHYVVKSDIPPRWSACLRLTYYTLLVVALAWLTYLSGRPWWLFYLVLWIVPLGTTFSFFMLLRQLVQHGNADQQRLTNTCVFEVAWPIAAAVFPIGNDYHLPHHLFPMVPHYNLKKLHRLLLQSEEYRSRVVVVDGYFRRRTQLSHHPTVLEMMTRQMVN